MNREIRERLVVLGFPAPEVIKWLNQVLTGYFHYYGITDNIAMLCKFTDKMKRILFKWLNRRSQKRSYTWEQFNLLKKDFPIVTPRIYVSIYGD